MVRLDWGIDGSDVQGYVRKEVVVACRSAAAMKLGRHKEALQDAELAIEADTDFAKGYLRRAAANMALENFEAAQQDYEKVRPSVVILKPSIWSVL